MKNYKVESFIYGCFFLAALAFHESVEIQLAHEKKQQASELTKSNFADAQADITALEIKGGESYKINH